MASARQRILSGLVYPDPAGRRIDAAGRLWSKANLPLIQRGTFTAAPGQSRSAGAIQTRSRRKALAVTPLCLRKIRAK